MNTKQWLESQVLNGTMPLCEFIRISIDLLRLQYWVGDGKNGRYDECAEKHPYARGQKGGYGFMLNRWHFRLRDYGNNGFMGMRRAGDT